MNVKSIIARPWRKTIVFYCEHFGVKWGVVTSLDYIISALCLYNWIQHDKITLYIAPLGYALFQMPPVTLTEAVTACESENMTLVKADSAAKQISIQIYLIIIENLQRYVSGSHSSLISPWTKWRPFRRWYFLMHFRERKKIVFWLQCHWSSFLRVSLTITQLWFR